MYFKYIVLYLLSCSSSFTLANNEEHANEPEWPCKEVLVRKFRWSPTYSMDDATLNHVTVNRNSAGNLTYFKTHIAVQADKYITIRLSIKENLNSDNVFNIGVGWNNNQNTKLDIKSNSTFTENGQYVQTPDILSSSQFRAFYIKIDDGNLQFGKEGDSSPLMSHTDDRLRSVNYFTFYYGIYGKNNEARFRYDCPAPGEGSS